MTITPDQAKTFHYDDYPRPWEIREETYYDARGDYGEAWDVGPATVYDEDIAPLVAAAPDMAEQIATMTYEYAVQYKNDDGQWEYTYEEWNNRWQDSYITQEIRAQRDHPGEETRILRRLVGQPEVTP